MKLSISKNQNPNHDARKATEYIEKNFDSLEDVARELLKPHAWSANVWDKGKRHGANWKGCNALVLDVDDGLSIKEAEKMLTRYNYVLATTKSHQKEKAGKPPCDRYRIVIPATETVTDKTDFGFTMRTMIKQFKADTSCKDMGRFYWPHAEIVSVKTDGQNFKWQRYTDEEKANVEKGLPATGAGAAGGGARRKGRQYVTKKLRRNIEIEGVPERHKEIIYKAAEMARGGFTEEEARKIILQTPLAQTLIEEDGQKEIERHVANGYRAK